MKGLKWSDNCVIYSAVGATKIKITDKKLYVFVVTLSTQCNTKLLQQLKSGFKRTINWNKYQSKITNQAPNSYLDFLIDPSFQGVNSFFVLWRKLEKLFDEPVKSNVRTYDNIQKLQYLKEMITQLVVY